MEEARGSACEAQGRGRSRPADGPAWGIDGRRRRSLRVERDGEGGPPGAEYQAAPADDERRHWPGAAVERYSLAGQAGGGQPGTSAHVDPAGRVDHHRIRRRVVEGLPGCRRRPPAMTAVRHLGGRRVERFIEVDHQLVGITW